MKNIFGKIGKEVINFFAEFGGVAILLWQVIRYLPSVLKDKRLIVEQMSKIGTDSLPLVLLIGTFTGAIASLEATMLFEKFNLIQITQPFIGASVATAIFTELTPVLTALVIAGRVGGAMAAQIGTMQVSEQIDALEMMAIDKNRFLTMPRVFSTLFMMPVLAVFSNVVALLGAYAIVMVKFNFSTEVFFGSIQNFFNFSEIVIGITKSFFFGGVTALIGCHVGFATYGGAEGVGNSTVRSFTLSAAAILIIDALFGYIL